jgi:hypothetical protein
MKLMEIFAMGNLEGVFCFGAVGGGENCEFLLEEKKNY